MSDKFEAIDAKKLLDEIKANPRLSELLKSAVSNAKANAAQMPARKGGGPIVASSDGDKCGGCFVCLSCGATPTPDLEVACLVTVVHAA